MDSAIALSSATRWPIETNTGLAPTRLRSAAPMTSSWWRRGLAAPLVRIVEAADQA